MANSIKDRTWQAFLDLYNSNPLFRKELEQWLPSRKYRDPKVILDRFRYLNAVLIRYGMPPIGFAVEEYILNPKVQKDIIYRHMFIDEIGVNLLEDEYNQKFAPEHRSYAVNSVINDILCSNQIAELVHIDEIRLDEILDIAHKSAINHFKSQECNLVTIPLYASKKDVIEWLNDNWDALKSSKPYLKSNVPKGNRVKEPKSLRKIELILELHLEGLNSNRITQYLYENGYGYVEPSNIRKIISRQKRK